MRFPALAISLLFANSICTAQTSQKAQEIKDLLAAMDSTKNIEAVWDSTIPQMRAGLRQMIEQGLRRDKGEKPENIDAVLGKVSDEFRKQLHGQEAVDRIVAPMYDKYFSTEEVHQLRLFYESAVGKKLTALQPQFASQMMAEAQKFEAEAMGRVMSNREFRSKMEAILRGEAAK